ncbi:MAG: serine/threonine-protein kinase [Planctomycetes bacterium]|nr:serine/threonine-protein kinase [Planctomycetota bacterium]
MANAQDEAFVELGTRRGVLSPDLVRAARDLRADVGLDEPLPQLLLKGKLLAPAVVTSLLRDLTRGAFTCERCGERARYDALASFDRLACARCGGPLGFVDPSASDAVGSMLIEPQRPTGAHPAAQPRATGRHAMRGTGAYPATPRATGSFGPAPPPAGTGSYAAVGPTGPRSTGVHRQRPSGPLAPAAPPPAASVPPPDAWDAEATVIDKAKRRAAAAAALAARAPLVDDTLRAPAQDTVDSTVRDVRVLGLPGGQRQVGPYTLLQEIGRGAGGVIFLARRAGLERRFAVKVLLGDMARDEEAVTRFKREAAVASKVDDPGIIAVYDTGCDGGRYYYVMEYCPGATLEARLMDGALPPDDAARVVLSLARTVQAAHDRGVIHRDLKPANIILEDGSGRPRVMDFGVARDQGGGAGLSRTGELLGTPAYMAPEQLQGERDIDHRVDVYALGVILFECLAGRRPHVAATTIQLAERVIMEDAPALRAVAPAAPPALEVICRRALARDRGARYDAARTLARDLERFLAGRGVRTPSPGGGGRDRWTRRLVVGAALAVALALAALGWRAWSDHAAAAETRRREEEVAARAERARQVAARAETVRAALFAGEVDLARLRDEAAALAAAPEATPGARALAPAIAAITLARRPEERVTGDVLSALDEAIELAREDHSLQAALHLAAAEHLRRRARYQQAATRVEHALAELGRLGHEARLLRAHLLRQLGRRAEAAEQLRRLAAEDAGGALRLLAQAALLDPGQPAEALQLVRRACEAEPGLFLARVRLAHLLTVVQDHEKALEEVDRCLATAPDDQLCHAIRGTALHALERTNHALAAFDRAVELGEPQPDPSTLAARAVARRFAGERNGALRDLERALELRPDDVETLFLRGLVHEELDRPTAAESDWRQAFALDRDLALAQLRQTTPQLRARIAQAVGLSGGAAPAPRPDQVDQELALRADARAVRVPEPARVAVREALLLAARGRPWREVEAALDRAPDGPEVALERARVSLGRDAVRPAEEALDRLRALGVATPEVARLEAELALRRGRLGDAERRYRELAGRDAGVEGLVARGEAERLVGRLQAAHDAAVQALTREPEHAAALALRAEALLALRPDEPREALEAAVRALAVVGGSDTRILVVRMRALVANAMREMRGGGRRPGLMQQFELAMRDAQTVVATSAGAGPRLAIVDTYLDTPDPALFPQATALLQDAQLLDPERPELHLVVGRYLLLTREPAEVVLEAWRQARAEPLLRLPPHYAREFQQRFGRRPELDALLEDR